jgi:hypothetical protein
MSFSVRVRGMDGLKARFFEIKKNLITAQLLVDMAEEVRSAILKRTARGLDYKGKPFKPYSRRWKAERRKRGKQTSRVDLNFTGRMLGDVLTMIDPASGRAVVSFGGSGTGGGLAYYHNVSGAGSSRVRREFFALSEEDKENLKKMLEEHIDRVVRDAS